MSYSAGSAARNGAGSSIGTSITTLCSLECEAMRTILAAGLAVAVSAAIVNAQAGDTPESHIAAAKAAAHADLTGLFDVTCGSLTRPPAGRGTAPAGAQTTLARDNWHAE